MGVLARTDIFMTLSNDLTLPGGAADLTGISTTLQSALDPPRSLTPPDGAPDQTGTSRILSPPRDLTRRDGVGAQMAIFTTLLRSRYVINSCFASFSSC